MYKKKKHSQVTYKNLMNISVASFDINNDSFLFVYSRRATTQRDAHLTKKLGPNKCMHPYNKNQRLRARRLKDVRIRYI